MFSTEYSSSSTAMTCPIAPRALHPLRSYYGAVRPSPAHRYFQPRGWSRLCLFPSHHRQGSHVYTSLIELRGTTCRMALGPSQDILQADPEEGPSPGSDIASSAF